jgi:2-dehydropantoate 2-reductase
MRIGVIGAGSIGGHLAVLLANAGHEVTVIARGAHLEAIRRNGLRVVFSDGSEKVARQIAATSVIGDAGVQDVVVLGVKAHQVEAVVDELPAMFDDATVLLPMQNGVPWWYFQRSGSRYEGHCVRSVDPRARLMTAIDPRRIIGAVVYPAATIAAPGVIRHIEGDRYPLGELDGTTTERITRISQALVDAGLKAPILPNIRNEIWLKLWGNLTFNPISALAHATLVDICRFPESRELAAGMMAEAQAIAAALGITFRVSIEQRINGAERVGKHKTSMLQDVEAGREPEIDALVGAVIELGRLTGTPTPHIDAVHALVKLLAHTMATERVGVRAVASAGTVPAAKTAPGASQDAVPVS